MSQARIALVGDYSDRHAAHRAIPRALEMARSATGAELAWDWVPTRAVAEPQRDLRDFSAVWLVPASPYESLEGALAAVRWAREGRRPFMGTCGGFQHAVIEFARNVAGIADADHAETSPEGAHLVVSRLSCSLVGVKGRVRFEEGSLLRAAYGKPDAVEGYQCNYGIDPAHGRLLADAGLRYTAWDDAGEVRAAEWPGQPFFVGMLFQPERAALQGELPPPVRAFAEAVVRAAC